MTKFYEENSEKGQLEIKDSLDPAINSLTLYIDIPDQFINATVDVFGQPLENKCPYQS